MPEQVYEETDTYRVAFDDDRNCVVFTWKKFAKGDEFQEGSNALLEQFKKADTNKLLTDTSGIKAHTDEDEEWLAETWVPKMIDAGLEYGAVVHADGVISSMDAEDIEATLDQLPYEAFWTSKMREARDWIESQ